MQRATFNISEKIRTPLGCEQRLAYVSARIENGESSRRGTELTHVISEFPQIAQVLFAPQTHLEGAFL